MIEVLGEGGHNLLWEGKQQHLILHREEQETCASVSMRATTTFGIRRSVTMGKAMSVRFIT